jgi:hypothetical protein
MHQWLIYLLVLIGASGKLPMGTSWRLQEDTSNMCVPSAAYCLYYLVERGTKFYIPWHPKVAMVGANHEAGVILAPESRALGFQ